MVLAAHAQCGTAVAEHLAGAVGRVLVACFMADVGRAQLMELAARPAALTAFCERQRIAPRDMHLTLHALHMPPAAPARSRSCQVEP